MLRVLKGPSSELIGKHYFITKQFTNRYPSSMKHIPNKYVIFDDRDPPWMNDFVKAKIKFKNQLCNTYIKNDYKENDYNILQEAIYEVSKIISKRKEEYHYHLATKLVLVLVLKHIGPY